MRSLVAAVLFSLPLLAVSGFPLHACTTFCLDTPDGPIFGSNLDVFIPGDGLVFVNLRDVEKTGFQTSTTGEKAQWVSRYGSVTFNPAGREFAFGGMNEVGLVVGGMELRASKMPKPDERPPVTLGTWVQYVLDTCGSIEEAIHVNTMVRIEDQVPPGHFLIADSTGSCVAIEWLGGHLVHRTGEDLPVKAMSNMRYERALEALERGGPRWWWSNPGKSAERFAGAAARNKSFDARRDSNAIRYAFDTLTRVVAAPHTKWNIVYDIPKREVWFRSAASPTVKHLSLRAFDLSCDAPLLMLDVNATLEGNVEGFFTGYSHDVNLRVFRTLCDRYDIDVSAEAAADIMKLFESFACVP